MEYAPIDKLGVRTSIINQKVLFNLIRFYPFAPVSNHVRRHRDGSNAYPSVHNVRLCKEKAPMATNLQLIFLAHPRSGSSSLYQMLQLHPALQILEEPFNENFNRWSPDSPAYRELVHDRASLDAQLSHIFTRHNGLKILDYQLEDHLLAHLLHQPQRHVLFLRRRNLLQSVVSVLIAKQTQLWKKWEMTEPLEAYYRDLQPLDIAEVQSHVAGLREHLALCQALVESKPGIAPHQLVYEDLYFAPESRRNAQIAQLWQWLDLPPLDPQQLQTYLVPARAKINSATTYAWLPNAREIEQQCGSDETGWLFDSGGASQRAPG